LAQPEPSFESLELKEQRFSFAFREQGEINMVARTIANIKVKYW
jgi:hypothetical protein